VRTALPGFWCALVLAACATPWSASAQSIFNVRPAIEVVAAAAGSSDAVDDPFVVFDFASTIPVATNFDVIVRPYVRRLPGGDWDALLYQAQVRYQPLSGVRIDAGIITSPIGLGTLELRPDLNPTVGYPFYYFGRLPLFDEFANRLQILSGGYPLGAVVSLSSGRWDARAGVTDGTPARYRNVLDEASPGGMPQAIAGGGVTLMPGLRIGGAVARGQYRRASDADYYGQATYGPPLTDASALVFNLEAEFAFRYTRLSGEWVRDRFDSPTPAISRGFYVQGVQTITPRTFAAARLTRASSPVQTAGGRARWTRTTAEMTGGYRLSPDVTLRAGYEAGRAFGVQNWNHAAVFSVVWSKRWF
jgi:hypothetical protein